MTMIEKIEKMKVEKGDTNASLARNAGIPYTTIDGLYKKGTEKAKHPTLQKLCTYFNCSLDYLVKDEIADSQHGKGEAYYLTEDEAFMMDKYRKLDESQKEMIRKMMR